MKSYTFFILLITSHVCNAQTKATFTDERDGQVYKTITYHIDISENEQKKMTWMAENLNYMMEGSFCRNDSLANCDTYGRYYFWPSAMKSCPKGWHLPTNAEWTLLANLYGGVSKAGTHLKSTSNLWNINGKGTNKSFFNAMPYGTCSTLSGYHQFGSNAIFWSADEKNAEYAWDWNLFCAWKKINCAEGQKFTTGNCVRCVKD